MYEAKLNSSFRDQIQLHSHHISSKFEQIKDNLKMLAEVRNNLFENTKDIYSGIESITKWSLENKQHFQLLNYCDKYESDAKFSIYKMAGIKEKTKDENETFETLNTEGHISKAVTSKDFY